jgi:hypothetical protein
MHRDKCLFRAFVYVLNYCPVGSGVNLLISYVLFLNINDMRLCCELWFLYLQVKSDVLHVWLFVPGVQHTCYHLLRNNNPAVLLSFVCRGNIISSLFSSYEGNWVSKVTKADVLSSLKNQQNFHSFSVVSPTCIFPVAMNSLTWCRSQSYKPFLTSSLWAKCFPHRTLLSLPKDLNLHDGCLLG